MTQHARINLNRGQEAIEINGHNITHAVRRIVIEQAAGDPYATIGLDLSLAAIEITEFGDPEPRVLLNLTDEERKALVACGWTPPAPATY